MHVCLLSDTEVDACAFLFICNSSFNCLITSFYHGNDAVNEISSVKTESSSSLDEDDGFPLLIRFYTFWFPSNLPSRS